jgi:FixJ family two-component response regulator
MNATTKISAAPLVSIVDDDASVRNSAGRFLRSSGLRAEAFASAEEFLQSEFLGQTACLLLDVRMNGMSGLALQQQLLKAGRRIPIVFLSAHATEDEEARAMRAGAAGFLRKPVSKEALFGALRAVLEFPDRKQKDEL